MVGARGRGGALTLTTVVDAGWILPLQVVYWEPSKTCDASCTHDRAADKDLRSSQELTIGECRSVIDQLSAMGRPILVFCGKEVLRHPDLFKLIAYARQQYLPVGIAPPASPLLTTETIRRLQALGLSIILLGLDGPDADTHDSIHRSPGSFERTLEVIRYQRSLGQKCWVNTAFLPQNQDRIDAIAQLLVQLDVQAWNLMAVIPTDRKRKMTVLAPGQYENLYHHVYELSAVLPFKVTVSYAPNYRRVIYQRLAAEGSLNTPFARTLLLPAPMDANGSFFIDHHGEVCPSEHFPVSGGNVRHKPLMDIYDASPLFKELRDWRLLKGRCRWCNYVPLCHGGSRARAYAMTGDYLQSDPACIYQPDG